MLKDTPSAARDRADRLYGHGLPVFRAERHAALERVARPIPAALGASVRRSLSLATGYGIRARQGDSRLGLQSWVRPGHVQPRTARRSGRCALQPRRGGCSSLGDRKGAHARRLRHGSTGQGVWRRCGRGLPDRGFPQGLSSGQRPRGANRRRAVVQGRLNGRCEPASGARNAGTWDRRSDFSSTGNRSTVAEFAPRGLDFEYCSGSRRANGRHCIEKFAT